MTDLDNQALHLNRVDPTRNMRRFYQLTIQPTLFGEVSLVRNWGRIGTCGQSMMQTFDNPQAARTVFAKLERVKRGRGYTK
ncbi:WGR domain-containing protein [Tianweitania populi]|uniref:WGR domain-containing protein n=1 Tax=Tianweitania populi TaxID=1607949 RepID=A0A8J3DZ87_9HYPH|nr:WGR domain-containing protein [Tianweitania populi]GHD22971.1 WGR domain-containing protein [Tianweitania populi]